MKLTVTTPDIAGFNCILRLTPIGIFDGLNVASGLFVTGFRDGLPEGFPVTGRSVGFPVEGSGVGNNEGELEGVNVGVKVVGIRVGARVGVVVGGGMVGKRVGATL